MLYVVDIARCGVRKIRVHLLRYCFPPVLCTTLYVFIAVEQTGVRYEYRSRWSQIDVNPEEGARWSYIIDSVHPGSFSFLFPVFVLLPWFLLFPIWGCFRSDRCRSSSCTLSGGKQTNNYNIIWYIYTKKRPRIDGWKWKTILL